MQRIGRVGVVWEEGGGGRRGEEGERVVDLEMSEVPSEEAAWGKLMYMTLPHVAPETRPPLREQLQQLQHACSRIHDACLDPSSRILHTNGHGDKQGDGWLRGSRGSRGTGETHDQAASAASGSSSASSSSAQGRRIGYIRVFDFNTRTVPEVPSPPLCLSHCVCQSLSLPFVCRSLSLSCPPCLVALFLRVSVYTHSSAHTLTFLLLLSSFSCLSHILSRHFSSFSSHTDTSIPHMCPYHSSTHLLYLGCKGGRGIRGECGGAGGRVCGGPPGQHGGAPHGRHTPLRPPPPPWLSHHLVASR